MSASNSPANSAIVAELSFSFQDELTATIHNAFGVAVEIAVLEVTKLVGQALKDVRDQMHETLRENKSLQQRLQATELELSTVRASLEDESQLLEATVGKATPTGRIQQINQPQSHLIDSVQAYSRIGKQIAQGESESLSVQHTGALLNVEEKYGFLGVAADTDTQHNRSFCEIREDGQVCSHDLNPDIGSESTSRHDVEEVSATKANQTCLYTDTQVNNVHFNQACQTRSSAVDSSRTLVKELSMPDDAHHNSEVKPQIKVKEESSDLGCGPGSGAYVGAGEDFGPDSLSLAQSKLLEDWRPEPLHLQNCETDPLVPCTSHSLSDSPDFNSDVQPPATSLPPSFPKPYPPEEAVGVSASHRMYVDPVSGLGTGSHVCRVCGESFPLAEELRRHRSQHHHSPRPNKNPKRQIFPPGRSPYHCSLCGRDFNRMEHLKIHQRIHTGERPYACSVCQARFRHSWALTRHFRIHTGEKPYACSQCGKTFRNCGGLRFHQRSHAMEANT